MQPRDKMKNVVFGEGPPDARIMLVGQNPVREEAKQGRPFVGKSGKFLNEILEKYSIDRDRLYITSVVKRQRPVTGNQQLLKSNSGRHI